MMKRIFTLLFVLLSLVSFGQSAFHSLISQPAGNLELTFAAPVTMDGEDWNIGDRSPGEIADMFPAGIYDSQGRTLLAIPTPWNTSYRSMALLVKYDQYGLYPASIEVGDKTLELDRHLSPSIVENNSGDIIVMEQQEHTGAIRVYKGPSDLSTFTYQGNGSSTVASRLNVFKLATGFAIIHQQNDEHIVVSTCDENGLNWTPVDTLLNSIGSNIRCYPNTPMGTHKDTNGWYYFTIEPRNTTAVPYYINCVFLLKTQDFSTFYNYTETHSFVAGSGMSELQFSDNGYTFAGAWGSSTEIEVNPCAIDTDGNFYRVEWANVGTKLKTYRYSGGSIVTVTSTTDHNITTAHFGQFGLKWLCKRGNALYLIATISNGTVGKPHLLKSTDNGANWTDLGDMLPGINETTGYYRAMGPANVNEIPDNTNFSFYFSEPAFDNTTGTFADMYQVTAAFGTIQSESSLPAPSTITNINDVSGARYIYESDNMSGGQFVDKSSAARGMTTLGAPTLTSGEVIFDGVDDGYQLSSAANFAGDTAFTIFVVARALNTGSGTDRWFASFGASGNNNNWAGVGVQLTKGPKIQFRNGSAVSSRFTAYGVEDVNDGNFKIFTFKGDGLHYRMFVNGKEVNKVYEIDTGTNGNLDLNGLWGTSANTTWDRARIAVIARQTAVFTNVGEKVNAYYPSCISLANQRSIEHFLANKYSITLEE